MGSILIFLYGKIRNLLDIAKVHLKRYLRKQTVRDQLQISFTILSEFKRINHVSQ